MSIFNKFNKRCEDGIEQCRLNTEYLKSLTEYYRVPGFNMESANIHDYVENIVSCAAIHNKSFGDLRDINIGKNVVIFATGPTLDYYDLEIDNAYYIGVNHVYKLQNIKLDALFCQDANTVFNNRIPDEFFTYPKNPNCIKFIGNSQPIPNEINSCKNNIRRYMSSNKFNVEIDTRTLPDFTSVVFSAFAFALWTKPKRIYLVGADCSSGHAATLNAEHNGSCTHLVASWKEAKKFKDAYYNQTEIISVNPVGLKGIFSDIYTEKYKQFIKESQDKINKVTDKMCVGDYSRELIKEKLQIVLITYNRKEFLKQTLDSILDSSSPIKDFDIKIIDNNSTDGTCGIVKTYQQKHPNLAYEKNKINIGGNPNICKAFSENLNKEYIWLLADNDMYNFDSWDEVVYGINNGYDVILTRNCKNNISEIFHEANFVPSCIYKTKNITSDVIENMYDNISNLFSHLALIAKNINDNKEIYIVSKNIVAIGTNPGYATTYNRGRKETNIPEKRRNMFWSVGFFNSIQLILDRKKQIEIIDNLTHFHKNLFELFKSIIIYNSIYRGGYIYNLEQIFRVLSFKQKIKFILAYINVKFSFKNYKYWFIRNSDEWIENLQIVDEQKYINKLAKKYKNKKVLLYGAGMFFDILKQNYDLSKLNIVAISDIKFENSLDTEFCGYKVIKPSEIKEFDCDVILFTLKLYKKIEISFKCNGIKKPMCSLIKTDKKYPMRF